MQRPQMVHPNPAAASSAMPRRPLAGWCQCPGGMCCPWIQGHDDGGDQHGCHVWQWRWRCTPSLIQSRLCLSQSLETRCQRGLSVGLQRAPPPRRPLGVLVAGGSLCPRMPFTPVGWWPGVAGMQSEPVCRPSSRARPCACRSVGRIWSELILEAAPAINHGSRRRQ